jgi:hypothetical protein
MTNPLIQKYEELYGKKEEPKKVEDALPKDLKDQLKELLKELPNTSIDPVNTPNIITKANHIPSLITYDVNSGEGSFLQIAEKVKNKDARVTSVTLNRDAVGGIFSTGLTTITFEVQVWDTP